jgi:hypothetical protein
MISLNLDLSKRGSAIKPMNAVNNGPTNGGVRKQKSNFDDYKELEIPYARNHDASFFQLYGGEHTVDVHRIFRDFSADENDPASYIFEPTDNYVKNTMETGTQTFYRLGASIEHHYKFGTKVPKDMAKWARIAEHIIRHYNEGWANGFEYNITHWEIWNEPDCMNPDGSNPCWQGTEEEFIKFYGIVAKHLKSRFPSLTIGGPAFCGGKPAGFKRAFLEACAKNNTPLDFFSFHWYGRDPLESTQRRALIEEINDHRALLDEFGFKDTKTILNEWNYVTGWLSEDFAYSKQVMKNLKGSAFILASMFTAQSSSLDMFMYYDLRPCAFCGPFETDTYRKLKPFYSFIAFRNLRRLGTQIPFETDSKLYGCAATDGKKYGIALTHYNDDDSAEPVDVKLSLCGLAGKKEATVYILDEERDLAPTRGEVFTSDEFSLYLKLPNFTSVYIEIE